MATPDDLEFFRACIDCMIDRERQLSAAHGFPFDERTVETHHESDFSRAVLYIVKTIDDARRFHAGYLAWLKTQESHYTRYVKWRRTREWDDKETPEKLALTNIGKVFTEGMKFDKIQMWQDACGAVHPVFGWMDSPPITLA